MRKGKVGKSKSKGKGRGRGEKERPVGCGGERKAAGHKRQRPRAAGKRQVKARHLHGE